MLIVGIIQTRSMTASANHQDRTHKRWETDRSLIVLLVFDQNEKATPTPTPIFFGLRTVDPTTPSQSINRASCARKRTQEQNSHAERGRPYRYRRSIRIEKTE